MFRDLRSKRLIYLKGGLFLLMGIVASVLLLVEAWSIKVAFLLGVAVWGFCRFYYFVFYVIEKYVDPSARYSGLIDFLWRGWRKG